MTTMNNEDPADPSVHERLVLDTLEEVRHCLYPKRDKLGTPND